MKIDHLTGLKNVPNWLLKIWSQLWNYVCAGDHQASMHTHTQKYMKLSKFKITSNKTLLAITDKQVWMGCEC